MPINYGAAKGNSLVKKAAASQASTMNAEKIYSLDMAKIHEHPDNRKIFNMEGISGLAGVIKEDGFTGAIEVYQREDGEYEILSGHRRFAACKEAGMNTIPAVILPKTDDVSRAKKLITSNIHNRELTAMDKARAIDYYIEHVLRPSGAKNIQNEVASVFQISVTQVKYLRKILKFVPELQALLEHDLVPYSGIVKASSLSEEEQKHLASEYSRMIKLNDGEPLGKVQAMNVCEQMVRNHELAEQSGTKPVLREMTEEEIERIKAPKVTKTEDLPETSELSSTVNSLEEKESGTGIVKKPAKPREEAQSKEYVRKEHERISLYAVDLLKENLLQEDITEEFKDSIRKELNALLESI